MWDPKNLRPTTYIGLKYACFFPDTCGTSWNAAFGDAGSFFTTLRAATSDVEWCRWAEKVLMGIIHALNVDVLYLVATRMVLIDIYI